MQVTDEATRALLTARNVAVDFGAELLDDNDEPVGDLTCTGGDVSRNNFAAIHGICRVQLRERLNWNERPRVRLHQSLSVDGVTWTRFNLGIFVLTTPTDKAGEDPPTYDVDGYDKLYLLGHEVGDTYVVDAGTGYLAAARQAITDAGVAGLDPLFDTTAETKVLAQPFVWILDPGAPITWLQVVNDLLTAVGYQSLWVDGNGRYRSGPYQDPTARPPEWVFDVTDSTANVVLNGRVLETDGWTAVNWWRFLQPMAMLIGTSELRPVEGEGQFTIDNTGGGQKRARVLEVAAADQDALEAIAAQTVAQETAAIRLLSIALGPFPILGHTDVTSFVDPALGVFKVLTREHTIPLAGGPVQLHLQVVEG